MNPINQVSVSCVCIFTGLCVLGACLTTLTQEVLPLVQLCALHTLPQRRTKEDIDAKTMRAPRTYVQPAEGKLCFLVSPRHTQPSSPNRRLKPQALHTHKHTGPNTQCFTRQSDSSFFFPPSSLTPTLADWLQHPKHKHANTQTLRGRATRLSTFPENTAVVAKLVPPPRSLLVLTQEGKSGAFSWCWLGFYCCKEGNEAGRPVTSTPRIPLPCF